MTYDFIQHGSRDGDGDSVSSCCKAPVTIEKDYGGLITSAVECSSCRFACSIVSTNAIDS